MALIRSLREQPRNISTSAGLDAFLRHGSGTYAGADVNPSTAMTVSAVFACIRITAEDLAKLPVIIYQNGEQRERAINSPFWRLLHDRPNGWQTSQQFRELLTSWAVARGNGCAYKNIVGNQVRELIPIPPERLRIEQLADHEIRYHVRQNDGTEAHYTKREIFHLMGPSTDGYQGVSVIHLARQGIGLALAMERHAATLFGNGARPGGVLKHPQALSEEAYDRLQASIDEGFTRENAHKTMILEEGMEWIQTGLSNEDTQFLESRQFSVIEVARWFRMPPHKLGELGRATWNNVEGLQIQYLQDVLLVWAQRWDSAFNQQVIGTNGVYAETMLDGVLRGTTKERYEAYQLAAGGNAPWLTRAEIRRRENLPPKEGLDEILTPLNMQGGSDPAADDASEDDNPEPTPDGGARPWPSRI